MNKFVETIGTDRTHTENGMSAYEGTGDKCLDLFSKIGASRGRDMTPFMMGAFIENPELAIRIMLWARDIRGGAGERQHFIDFVNMLANQDIELAKRVVSRIPELGRWKDGFSIQNSELLEYFMSMVIHALHEENGLCAKWCPRKGPMATKLREAMKLTPKQYRKLLVGLTSVVETLMCAKSWDDIDFNHVPSVALTRYKKAFYRHTHNYATWAEALASGDPEAKVNASAVYPYQVISGHYDYTGNTYDSTEKKVMIAQWDALPDYMNDHNVLAMVDTSGSMMSHMNNMSDIKYSDIAFSLGIYCADKAKSAFKDVFLTFDTRPILYHLKGNISQKLHQMVKADWGGTTDLEAAFKKILSHAVQHNVPAKDMPETIIIFSDMQFNYSVDCISDTAQEMIRKKYAEAGYTAPKVVFWNLNSRSNSPALSMDHNVALVSGFSPALMKSLLSDNLKEFTPYNMMLKTVNIDRYDF